MLLQNLRIVTSTHAPTEYEDMKAHIKQPSGAESMTTSGFYFCISEDGISYVNYLLSAREACQKAALWAENNLFYVAALGHLMRIAKHVEPYLVAGILPFVPDRALLQMFRMDRFMGTPIPQYNKILLGETSTEDYDCSLYRHAKGERALEANEWERVASLFRHIEEENYDANPAGPPEILAFFSSKRPKNHQEAPKQVEQEPAAASRDQAWLQQLILDRKINGQYYPLSELEQEGDFLSWIRTNENLRRNRLYLWRRKETKGLGWEDQQLEEYGFTKVKQPLFA